MAFILNNSNIAFPDGSTQTSTFTDTGTPLQVQVFTSSGYWLRPQGATKIVVKLVGGGGGGAGYCESGGAGGYCEGMLDVSNISNVTVTVGSAGSAVVYYAGAGSGTTSSFGAYFSASGGGGANTYYQHSGGFGGVGSGGNVNVRGGGGTGHTNSVGHFPGGKGGGSYFGSGSIFIRNHSNLSGSFMNKPWDGAPGAGGPGGLANGTQGSNQGYDGERGLVIVYSYQ